MLKWWQLGAWHQAVHHFNNLFCQIAYPVNAGGQTYVILTRKKVLRPLGYCTPLTRLYLPPQADPTIRSDKTWANLPLRPAPALDRGRGLSKLLAPAPGLFRPMARPVLYVAGLPDPGDLQAADHLGVLRLPGWNIWAQGWPQILAQLEN